MLSNRALRAGAGGRAARTRAAAFGRNPPSAPDEPKAARGAAWLENLLARFGPTTDRAQNLTTLDFEKPLLELDKRIKEVRSADRGA
jgi:acetyl-CoA carboxylase carboxyl transferase subunit alpha